MTQNLASLSIALSASAALSIVFKATVMATAGLLLTKAMRTTRASRRFVVLAWTFAVLSAVPIFVVFAPGLPLVVREIRLTAPSAPAGPAATETVTQPQPATSQVAGTSPTSSVGIGALMILIWGIGAAISLVPIGMTIGRLRELRRTARMWNHQSLGNLGQAPVLLHDRLTAPITFGWRRPCVLLPGDVDTWTAEDIERALVHENEHVARRDWPVHVFARLVCAVYWFHPLVWIAWRHLHLEADRACDDAVAGTCDAREFAEQLITLAGQVRSSTPAPALSMAGGSLVMRINALLNPNQARGRSGRSFAIAISLGAILVGAIVSTVEAVEQTTLEARPVIRHTPKPSPAPRPTPRPVVKAPSAAPARPVIVAPAAPIETAAAMQSQRLLVTVARPDDYVIGPGDILIVADWNQKPVVTGDYVVRPDGKITVPLIQDVEVAGLTPAQLGDRLTELSRRFVVNSKITVGVRAINSRKVFIAGGVVKPGAYDLLEGMTVLQLISLAGGLRDFAVGTDILVLRAEKLAVRFHYGGVTSVRALSLNITLKPGDVVTVPE